MRYTFTTALVLGAILVVPGLRWDQSEAGKGHAGAAQQQKDKGRPDVGQVSQEEAIRALMRHQKTQIDGTAPPASWPEKIRREKTKWIVDIDTRGLPGGYPEQIVVEVTAVGGHAGNPQPQAGSGPERPLSVSLVQLIATPDAFHGKFVQVQGFVRIEHEGTAVYLHRDDSEHMLTRNGLWIEANCSAAEGTKEAQVNNRYAMIVGQFNSKSKGHLGLWSGSIEKITRMQAWNIRKGAR